MNYNNNPWDFTHNHIFNADIGSSDFFASIEQSLPAVFSREFASKAVGELVSAKTMSNEDSLGTGPAVKVKVGSKVGYTKEAFMEWFKRKVRH